MFQVKIFSFIISIKLNIFRKKSIACVKSLGDEVNTKELRGNNPQRNRRVQRTVQHVIQPLSGAQAQPVVGPTLREAMDIASSIRPVNQQPDEPEQPAPDAEQSNRFSSCGFS